jgi:predicted CoA-binding protein
MLLLNSSAPAQFSRKALEELSKVLEVHQSFLWVNSGVDHLAATQMVEDDVEEQVED